MLKIPFVALVLALGVSVPVLAAVPGECATPEAITAQLKGEGQRTFAHADRPIGNGGANGMLFTMNADRSVGYILRSDRPMGERASSICVYLRLVKIRLFDARKDDGQDAALLKATDADASRLCDELAKERTVVRGACGSFNGTARKVATWGERILFQGFLSRKQPDGSFKETAALMTISGVVGGKLTDNPDVSKAVGGAMTFTFLPEGASFIDSALMFVEYTPYGLALLPP